MPGLCAWFACLICVPGLCAQFVCLVCVPSLYAWFVYPVCVPGLCARFVCPVCVLGLCAWFVYLVWLRIPVHITWTMPHFNAWFKNTSMCIDMHVPCFLRIPVHMYTSHAPFSLSLSLSLCLSLSLPLSPLAKHASFQCLLLEYLCTYT